MFIVWYQLRSFVCSFGIRFDEFVGAAVRREIRTERGVHSDALSKGKTPKFSSFFCPKAPHLSPH